MKVLRDVLVMAMIVAAAGCDDKEESCEEEGETRCSEDVLQVCEDGAWVEDEDCASEGMICHEDSHCMLDGEM